MTRRPREESTTRPKGLPVTARERFARKVESGEIELFGEATGEPVQLQPHSRAWELEFNLIRDRLADSLGDAAIRIDHVGSTAVFGRLSKPTIDIQVSVLDIEKERHYRPQIEGAGFPLRSREPGHRYFRTVKGAARRVHIHVCEAGSEWERDHLLFRDYLRAHPDEGRRYAALKERLARIYANDRLAYTEGKTPFIRDVIAAAEDWAARTGWVP
jgi:GrpB-like predicted nucleotidyltransferase (UPF0157 family)